MPARSACRAVGSSRTTPAPADGRAARGRSRRSASSPAKVELLGGLRHYDTITGFRIHPVVGWIEPPVALHPRSLRGRGGVRAAAELRARPGEPPPRQLRPQRRHSGTSTCCRTSTATSGARPPASWSTSPGCSPTEPAMRILLRGRPPVPGAVRGLCRLPAAGDQGRGASCGARPGSCSASPGWCWPVQRWRRWPSRAVASPVGATCRRGSSTDGSCPGTWCRE